MTDGTDLPPHEILTKAEVAERLKLSLRGVENLMRRGAIPYSKSGGRYVRFNWRDVVAAERARVVSISTES